jgi:hypothetical protein
MQQESFVHELVVSALVVAIAASVAHIAMRILFGGGPQWLMLMMP